MCRKKSWRTNSLNEYSFSSAINRFILFKLIRILKLILYTPTHFLLMHSKKIKSLFKHSVWKYIVKYSLNYVYDFNNLEETKFIFMKGVPWINFWSFSLSSNYAKITLLCLFNYFQTCMFEQFSKANEHTWLLISNMRLLISFFPSII